LSKEFLSLQDILLTPQAVVDGFYDISEGWYVSLETNHLISVLIQIKDFFQRNFNYCWTEAIEATL